MVIFWAFFIAINLFYYRYVREAQDFPTFKWRRVKSTEFIEERSCSQLSYIWNFGAPRGCEVTDESRLQSGWDHRRVPSDHSQAPTSILLHDVHTTGGPFTPWKLFYLFFLCLSGFIVVYKYVYPLFDIKWN